MFLQGLGKLSVKGIAEIAGGDKRNSDGENEALKSAKKSLLRSKGFVWMGTSKTAAYFISHAGQYLELMVLGRWWADISQAEWPKGSEDEITVDFEGHQGMFNKHRNIYTLMTAVAVFSNHTSCLLYCDSSL